MDSADALTALLLESAIPTNSEAARRLISYLALLKKWNDRINLSSSTEWDVIGPKFQEGIWASRQYPGEASAHLDIGSGAGFPALLLKIFHPRLRLELIESRGKKCQFLEMAFHTLGLQGVHIYNARLSDYLRQCPEDAHWDCISWKALRLSPDDVLHLREHAREQTQFWMFHGLQPAWEETEEIRRRFALLRKEKIPGRRGSFLSIYATR